MMFVIILVFQVKRNTYICNILILLQVTHVFIMVWVIYNEYEV